MSETTRRGFLGTLAALAGATFLPKAPAAPPILSEERAFALIDDAGFIAPEPWPDTYVWVGRKPVIVREEVFDASVGYVVGYVEYTL